MADLEKHLRTQLLVRTSRRVELTDAGRAYVAASKRILEQVEEAERAAAGEYSAPRGELHVTAPEVFGRRHLLPVALDFLAEHPEITLRLFLADRQVNLAEEHIDLALRIGHLEDSGLIATRVGVVRRVICASPAYLARCGTPQRPEDLKDHDGITFRGFPIAPEWRYRKDSPALAVEPRTRLAVNSHGGGRRCGACRARHHSRALVPGRGRAAVWQLAAHPGGVRAGADAGQPRLPACRPTAAEDESLPELDHAAPPSAPPGDLTRRGRGGEGE